VQVPGQPTGVRESPYFGDPRESPTPPAAVSVQVRRVPNRDLRLCGAPQTVIPVLSPYPPGLVLRDPAGASYLCWIRGAPTSGRPDYPVHRQSVPAVCRERRFCYSEEVPRPLCVGNRSRDTPGGPDQSILCQSDPAPRSRPVHPVSVGPQSAPNSSSCLGAGPRPAVHSGSESKSGTSSPGPTCVAVRQFI
jgi:hypothetical protein